MQSNRVTIQKKYLLLRIVASSLIFLGLFTNSLPFLGLQVAPAQSAITFRAATTFEDTSVTANCGSGANRPTVPTGTTTGDVMVAFFQNDRDVTLITAPGGWTLATNGNLDSTAQDFEINVLYKVVTSTGETGPITFALTGSTSWCTGGVITYVGVNTSTPIDIVGTAQGTTSPMSAPSVVQSSEDDLLVRGWAVWNGNRTIALPANYTSRFSQAVSSPTRVGDRVNGPTGATGNVNATVTTPQAFLSATVALRSAASAQLTLSNYRWYHDSNLIDVTNAWGTTDIAQNTAITPLPFDNYAPTSSAEMRLRVNFTVGSSVFETSTRKLKLQYKRDTDGSCTTGSWTDVGENASTTVPWIYATSSVDHGATTTVSRLSPVSDVLNNYGKSASSSTTTANRKIVAVGLTTEYDFHILDNGASSSAQYSFRPVQTNNTVLTGYTVCPTLTTAPVIEDEMRHGNFFTDGSESGYYWTNN